MFRRFVILAVLLCFDVVFAAELQVTTYNTGLLKEAGTDLVPCVEPRVPIQSQKVLSEEFAPRERPFVVLLQEVWIEKAFNAYKALALKKGYSYSPRRFSEIEKNGQMILTNTRIKADGFFPFKEDGPVRRGLRVIEVDVDGRAAKVVNIHTTYSNAHRYSALQIQQFTELAHFLNRELASFDGSIVVAGDFNAGPNIRYVKQRYDPAKLLWLDWLLPMFEDRGFRRAEVLEDTWAEANPLVSKAAFAIKLYNSFLYGFARWETKTSQLDHIFVSGRAEVLDAKVVLNSRARFRCPGRMDSSGATYLSDHFGVTARIWLN